MTNKKELDIEQLEEVSGGKGDRIRYDDIKDVPIFSHIVYQGYGDGNKDHNVVLYRVDLDNDKVYVVPADDEAKIHFRDHHKYSDNPVYVDGHVTDEGDGTYGIYYTEYSPTYFYWK